MTFRGFTIYGDLHGFTIYGDLHTKNGSRNYTKITPPEQTSFFHLTFWGITYVRAQPRLNESVLFIE